MKRGTPEHKKMKRLAAELQIPLPQAVGIMEMLWHFVGKQAPEGDIGAHSDVDIAHEVHWHKKPSLLIDGLVSAVWLERNDAHRLIVHDWPDHCEATVIRSLIRAKKDFLLCYGRTVHITRDGKDRDLDSYRNVQKPDDGRPKDSHGTDAARPTDDLGTDGGRPIHAAMAKAKEKNSSSGWVNEKFESKEKTGLWDDIWLKTGKADAFRKFKIAARTPEDADRIIAAARAQGPGILERARRGGITPIHPATWLHQGRYDDEPLLLPIATSTPAEVDETSPEYLEFLAAERGA